MPDITGNWDNHPPRHPDEHVDAMIARLTAAERELRAKQGYHTTDIPKGAVGELSKVREELLEAMDAEAQGCRLMVLVELSDMLGAVRLYMEKYHPGYTMDDLLKMSDITRRVFENGHRS